MRELQALRTHLERVLDWGDAHATFDAAVDGIAPALRGQQPPGQEHSPWQLLEHMRLAQYDIFDFCVNPEYEEGVFPDDYWPATAAPPSEAAWFESIAAFKRENESLKQLARDPERDLFATIPHGSGQTYLREILLVADHNSYHIGQLISARRALGAWPKP